MRKAEQSGLFRVLGLGLWLLGSSAAWGQTASPVHHSLKVVLDPQSQRIEVTDTIALPGDKDPLSLELSLNSNLRISASSVALTPSGGQPGDAYLGGNSGGGQVATASRYRLNNPPAGPLVISYAGRIHEQVVQNSAEYAQSFGETSGIISADGVYLNGASRWIPYFGDDLVTFDLSVEFAANAADWTAVSQGNGTARNTWVETNPMEEIYLIAARFTLYAAPVAEVQKLVYLRTPDPNLATRYLDATTRYLALYEQLLGEYPFGKFALVENFWETGYGMPSFTLLGEQVIRLPFIIDSSYPHEILHNWWGNGVYPDYESGNWSEGLTAYLADHLFQEMNGLGAEHRKDNLIRYRNYVAAERDFPLNRFTARNSAATQAVGYGKSLMLWHMLRLEVGDAMFLEGLRQLYRDYRFRRAGFMDIAAIYSSLTGRDLQPFFEQWVNRTGAPEFQVSVEQGGGNTARLMFAQIQAGDPYAVTVPVALHYRGEAVPRLYNIPLSQKFQVVSVENYNDVQALVVDPYFDIFRKLHRSEIPPTIGQLFGAEQITFVLPADNREQWRQLATTFAAGVDADIVPAEALTSLPTDRSVWILGQTNPFADVIGQQLAEYGTALTATGVALAGSEVEHADRSTVLTARHPANEELALGWIHVDDMVALPGMIEKLPHYGKYSYLSFVGAEPVNDIKGNWLSSESPMQWMADGVPADYRLPALPVVPALAELPPRYLPESLERHVQALATMEMGGRAAGTAEAARAAAYIAEQFRAIGLQPLGGTYVHEWQHTSDTGETLLLRNVVGVIPGSDRQLSAQPAVLGAHFDHLGNRGGLLYAGADDNASGVSVMLEVAAALQRGYAPRRSLVFVAFDGEETGLLGSARFVANPPAPYNEGEFLAMVNLDGVGRLEGRPLQIFGGDSAYEWPFMAQGIGFTIGVSSTLAEAVIAGSDHVSFRNAGIPSIHVFSGVHLDYHQATDSPDKLDYRGMSDVALWVEEAMRFLGDREAPLRVTLPGVPVEVGTSSGAREASLGSVPDFGWPGPGVRLSGVTPGGAAEMAGLVANDVLLRYDDSEVTDLQTYSNLIRASRPGDTVRLQIQRAGRIMEVPVTLQAR